MLAHENPIITTKYIKLFNEIYGSKDLLIVIRGKVYEYLGMTIDFLLKIGCSITQYDFVKKMRKELHEELKEPYRTNPVADFLFRVDSKAASLSKEKREEYHKTMAKCI